MGSSCSSAARTGGGSRCFEVLVPCWAAAGWRALLLGEDPGQGTAGGTKSAASTPGASQEVGEVCAACESFVKEFAQGKHGVPLCRECLRAEDESNFEPLSPEERQGLDLLAGVLDNVPWTYWKPGEQPAKLLDWLFLGDLNEAMDTKLLKSRGIGAVLNLINWWELVSKRPDVPDLSYYYASQDVAYQEADSEDRLFFDIVEQTWPQAQDFLERCRSEGLSVIVNCKAGHNRSACVCICWLVVREGMSLVEAVKRVQLRRGTILSNHGFRLQLVRLALRLQRLGEAGDVSGTPMLPRPEVRVQVLVDKTQEDGEASGKSLVKVDQIIKKKRLSVKYDRASKDFSAAQQTSLPIPRGRTQRSLISEGVSCLVSQRMLSMELLACLWHKGKNFLDHYEYTASTPTVVGSGFSGDVVLCRRRCSSEAQDEGGVRCVKMFDLSLMRDDKLEKLKNEVVIYLSLEHPNIARLFDAYEDQTHVSLVMQYCSGGTLEDALHTRGSYSEAEFAEVAVQMLQALHYIHCAGIVHRDIKPRNFVYEADGETLKLIDFGFSVKGFLSQGGGGGLKGCLGTLGYLAPEVARAGTDTEVSYTEKVDLWSLGCVFFELLAGRSAFHREQGQCDGYTEEVVLREIEDAGPATIAALLEEAPPWPRPLLGRLLENEAEARPSARAALDDECLAVARGRLARPPHALPVEEVLERFRAHGRASKPTRAWLLAMARSPTNLPWREFCTLRDTFKMFDALELSGTVNLNSFLAVVAPEDSRSSPTTRWEARSIWEAVCGEQESLSYCEFLAVLMPTVEDVFQDVNGASKLDVATPRSRESPMTRSPQALSRQVSPEPPVPHFQDGWNPSLPIASFLPLLNNGERVVQFEEDVRVVDVVRAMSEARLRWVVVRYRSGRAAFFDYMDISHHLVKSAAAGARPSEAVSRASLMVVGALANSSGHAAFLPMRAETPLADVLRLITQTQDGQQCAAPAAPVRRVPIVDSAGEVLHVFSCLDFLKLARMFTAPSAIMKSRSARAFDRRDTIMGVSVLHEDSMLNAFRIMDAARLTICPSTSRELSGDLGGVVAINVVSVADLKWVFNSRAFDILDRSVSEFINWRAGVAACSSNQRFRQQSFSRFNVVSVDEDESLHVLAQRMLASRLQRIFLSSEDLARIVGIVSSRDILAEVLDQLL